MAKNNGTFGARFSIDVSDLKKGLSEANRLIKESQSEFKAAAAGMDDWTKSQEGLTAKLKSLNQISELQQKKVDALKKAYKNAGYAADDMSAAAVNLRTDINNAQAALNKTEGELKETEGALEELNKESKLGSKLLKALGNSAEESGDGFTVAKGALANLISNGITALVGACKDAISSLMGLSEATMETRENAARLETAFKTAGFTAEVAADTYKDLYGILGDTGRATEAAQQLVKISDTQAELEQNTRILTGVLAEYGDSIPLEGLAEGIAATSKMSSVQGVLADALEWQGINLDDFNEKLGEMATEEERSAYVHETLLGLYARSGDAFRKNNESIIEAREATAEYQEKLDELGEAMEPISTEIQKGLTQVLGELVELFEGIDTEEMSEGIGELFDTISEAASELDLTAIGEGITSAFDSLINDVIPAIKDGFAWFKENQGIFEAVGIAIGVVTAALIAMNVALAAQAAIAAANPITWIVVAIVAAIAALVAAIVLVVKHWDEIRAAALNAWESIQSAWGSVADWFAGIWESVTTFFTEAWASIVDGFNTGKEAIVTAFDNAKTSIMNAFSAVGSFFSDLWGNIKRVFSNVGSYFSEKFNEAWSNVKNAFQGVADFFGGIWDTIVGTFKEVGTKVGDAIGGAFKLAINAAIATVEKAINLIPNAINGAIDLINQLPGVNISSIPTVSLPRLAKGGIVDSATAAIIGEAGREAIVPLENNTEWMDTLAEKLAEKMGGGGVVVNQTNHYAQTHSRKELFQSKKQVALEVKKIMKGAYA